MTSVVKKTFVHLCCKLWGEDNHWFDASTMIMANQMSQMLLLLPSCVAKLGWWRATLGTAVFGLLNCWTAHLMQVLHSRRYRHDEDDNKNEIIQWDQLLSDILRNHDHLEILRMLGMGFNCLCLLTRCIIQLNYAVSIIYFVNDEIEKRNWTYILACCCIPFTIVPTFRNYRIFSILSFLMATAAPLTIAAASLLHQPVQGVEHTVSSSSIQSLTWVGSTIVYAFGDTSASLEMLVAVKGQNETNDQFKYAFCRSTAYTIVLSLVAALSSYWTFGDQLSKVPIAAQPCTLALLPASQLRNIASICLLILELVSIGYSLCPLFTYFKRLIICMLPCINDTCHFSDCVARASYLVLVCIIATAIPFSGSMEITSLVGSLIVSPASYIIPAAAHMLYFSKSQQRDDERLSRFLLITSYMINIIQFAGVLIFVTVMGGILTDINKVFHSHQFHRNDFWNRCYLCADIYSSFL